MFSLLFARFDGDDLLKDDNFSGVLIDSPFLIGEQKIIGDDYPSSWLRLLLLTPALEET